MGLLSFEGKSGPSKLSLQATNATLAAIGQSLRIFFFHFILLNLSNLCKIKYSLLHKQIFSSTLSFLSFLQKREKEDRGKGFAGWGERFAQTVKGTGYLMLDGLFGKT